MQVALPLFVPHVASTLRDVLPNAHLGLPFCRLSIHHPSPSTRRKEERWEEEKEEKGEKRKGEGEEGGRTESMSMKLVMLANMSTVLYQKRSLVVACPSCS